MKWNIGLAALLYVVGLAACTPGYTLPLRDTGTSSAVTPGPNPTDPGPQPTGTGSPNDANTPTPQAGSGYTVSGRILPLGGTDNPNYFRFSWESIAIGVHFTGNDISANLSETPYTFLGHTGDAYYDVMVDGNITSSFNTTPTMQTYPLAQNVTAGEHTAWVIRRTEGMINSGEFNGLVVGTGTTLMTPPTVPTHRIEVLGASAETGYGVLATNCSGFSADQESADEAWPQLTANILGAELHNEAYSGKGLTINYDPVDDPTLTLPVLWQLTDSNDPNGNWNFANWIADVVVLDLGGNDYTGSSGGFDTAAFESAYVAFVQQIQKYYPKSMVYITVNPTDTGDERTALTACDQNVVNTLQTSGNPNVKFIAFPEYDGSVFGCDGHPSASLHQQTATRLATQIKTDLGW